MLIVTRFIAQHELKPLRRQIVLNDLLDGARKVKKGLGIPIKSPQSLEGYRFYKVRIGKKNLARMMVFLDTDDGKIVPVLIRLKKDKTFGMNMAMNNPVVVIQINKNLKAILMDMEYKQYEKFSL